MSELFSEALIVSLLAGAIRIVIPLILAAIGELIAQRSGVMNLGVEGMMLMGCFVGFYVTHETGSASIGIIFAVLASLTMSLIFAFMTITLKLEQFVTGLALNILAAGLTTFWFRAFYDIYRTETGSALPPTIDILESVEIPLLSDIPYLGEILFSQNWLAYFAYVLVPLTWFFLYKTRYGLELRCLGENPKAIDVKGLSVTVRRYSAVLFGGAMAGLGGAFISVGSSVQFVPDMVAGRGWLAIVIVIAGNWLPYRVVIAALIFALLGSFQLHVQAIGIDFPHQFLMALPFVVAILAMIWGKAKSEAPAALALPYRRESS